jgi:SAM-dependent methyltransferase
MTTRDWNDDYLHGDLPWDTDEPDAHLVQLVRDGVLTPGRALDVGSGTGTHALWLARQGFEVVGIDIAPRAVEMAVARVSRARVAGVSFAVLDFLAQQVPGAPFDLVFDRGCFHVFDDAGARARFAARVAGSLRPAGHWLSLIGSTEGPAREHGPPRRSAREVVSAVEPALEILSLRDSEFDANLPTAARAWVLLAPPDDAAAAVDRRWLTRMRRRTRQGPSNDR